MNKPSGRSILFASLACASTLAFAGCEEKPKVTEPATGGAATSMTGMTARPSGGGGTGKEYTIAWSVWTGWMPFKLMEQKGLLDKRGQELGVKIRLKEFKGYMDSVQAFAAKKVDGVAMTSMESLQPASNGVKSVGIVVNDVSNGGDGVLARKGIADVKGLKGQTVLLEQFSVSHYLLGRALESANLSERDVKIKNISGDDAGKAFLTDPGVKVVTTWNPHLFQATEQGKGKVIFSSRDIPGEIIDFLVVSDAALREEPKLGKALTEAWYDAMKLIADQSTRPEAIEIMAKGAGAPVGDFNKMLADTDLYVDRGRAGDFLESETLKKTMDKVKKFCLEHELIKDAKFTVGYGAGGDDLLRFDSTWVRGK
ncbi:MAG: ABC transporter substrate-binding protein [Deltaproteobacteria bacterium]|nr:ABC transporter substrate-binding protein [Deltaproteobacteria bacterium]